MEMVFSTPKLRKILNSSKECQKAFGAEQAKRILMRLQALAAAENLEVMRNLPGRCHELSQDRTGQFALDLKHPFRLVFQPADNPVPTKADGGVDWKQVTAVEILQSFSLTAEESL